MATETSRLAVLAQQLSRYTEAALAAAERVDADHRALQREYATRLRDAEEAHRTSTARLQAVIRQHPGDDAESVVMQAWVSDHNIAAQEDDDARRAEGEARRRFTEFERRAEAEWNTLTRRLLDITNRNAGTPGPDRLDHAMREAVTR